MRLLDLFCGAGGAGMGYHWAGWEVVGVDLDAQRDYPFDFVQADALAVLDGETDLDLDGFDAIHASPPCQRYSVATKQHSPSDHPDLVGPVRERVQRLGVAYIIENVPGAPLLNPIRLCGSSFGLDVQRHRLFESNVPLVAPPCNHGLQTPRFPRPDKRKKSPARVVPVFGSMNYAGDLAVWRRAMGMPWVTRSRGLAEAIPPAFTEYLGRQLWLAVRARRGLTA